MNTQRQSRIKLLLVIGIFFVPVLVAFVLNLTGWRPAGQKNYGELLSPPVAVEDAGLVDAQAGTPLAWANRDSKFRLVVRVPSPCDAACVTRIEHLDGLWRGLGVDATRLEVFFLGNVEGAALEKIRAFDVARHVVSTSRDFTPDDAGMNAFLVDPNGFLVLRYPPDFDLAGLRRDLSKIIR